MRLIRGVKVQIGEAIEIGKHRLLEVILLYQDKITAIQIDDVVKTLFKQIIATKIRDFQDKIYLLKNMNSVSKTKSKKGIF